MAGHNLGEAERGLRGSHGRIEGWQRLVELIPGKKTFSFRQAVVV
jgi:hypothetical protein